ncbi:Gfo/Idh/MocA family protein [Calycomorphotria hydatis]|uniref:Alpha-N-acetylgalactosaminidase n=1 Tax=Calycomorphotria hydatis TaxID=2528027 RepID=A0A517TBT4_9PLAN|nr:Gfo/Idh/MocA family oxidoreductase [Calycomorphotria hydatis]QDT65837.1 Alpha-N-acetylgalactosaminidase [Calycomorphotria hydatis]
MTSFRNSSRREFLQTTTTAAAAAATMPYWFPQSSYAAPTSALERPRVALIGCGGRGKSVANGCLSAGADLLAVADLDSSRLGQAKKEYESKQNKSERGSAITVDAYEDYRSIIDRDDIDAILCGTVDHWHTKVSIDAMRAGKDVYCEKPLTLTIDEGKQIIKVLEETNAVFQVGTQQRTEMKQLFLKAIAIVRDGRIGKVKKVTCGLNGNPQCDPIPVAPVPANLNWDMWLGQCPKVDYRYFQPPKPEGAKRAPRADTNGHYQFRWFYEYSGGKYTDWGAHHVDIAQWLIEQNGPGQGPTKVTPIEVVHPCEMDDHGNPSCNDRYNVPSKFTVQADFPNGVEMIITGEGRNGILVEGTEGRIFVSRGDLTGAPVEELESNPLPEGAIEDIYGGKKPGSHQANFLECMRTREKPISDVWSHHRAITTCHLAGIASRLNRSIEWDSAKEAIVGDEIANSMLAREQRKGYETNA